MTNVKLRIFLLKATHMHTWIFEARIQYSPKVIYLQKTPTVICHGI